MPAPVTQWIRDKGTIIQATTDVLVDELGNFFVDESGNNLADSLSTDGVNPAHSWSGSADPATQWAQVLGNNLPRERAQRTTAQGDVRITAQGDTRVTSKSQSNIHAPTSWTEDEY
jgi:hypothetical protein